MKGKENNKIIGLHLKSQTTKLKKYETTRMVFEVYPKK